MLLLSKGIPRPPKRRLGGGWPTLTVELGLETDDKSEMIPFLEGLVNQGRYDEAELIYTNQIKGHAETRLPLCAFLSKDPGYPPEFNYNYKKVYEILCGS